MKCEKAKQCNVCEGWFKMDRGCLLEKRCPSCRELNLQKDISARKTNPGYISFEPTLHSLTHSTKRSLIMTSPHSDVLRDYLTLEYIETHEYKDPCMDDELSEKLYEFALGSLNDKEKRVIMLRLGLGKNTEETLSRVGEVMNLSRNRIRQIELSALKKLKHPRVKNKIIDYLKGNA